MERKLPRHKSGQEIDREPSRRGPKLRLPLRSLDSLDGRTQAAKIAYGWRDDFAADRGGLDQLSAAQRAIVSSAALLTAMLESVGAQWLEGQRIDLVMYASLANALRRQLVTLGMKRSARELTPSLREYVRDKRAA